MSFLPAGCFSFVAAEHMASTKKMKRDRLTQLAFVGGLLSPVNGRCYLTDVCGSGN